MPEETIRQVLNRFEEVGLIDDAKFSLAWVEYRHQTKGLARSAIARELRAKGVADHIIEDALRTVDDEAEFARAREIAMRKASRLVEVDRQVAYRRIGSALARKGYSPPVVVRVLGEILHDWPR